MAEPTDEQLMERFCEGDDHAFEALFDRLAGRVHRFVGPMVRDPALAEDLLQMTFLSVLRSKDRYERGAPVVPWVFAIAANAARDAIRRRSRGVERLSATGVLEDGVTQDPDPADPALRRTLESALLALPPPQREAVILHKVHDLSFEQIAAALGTTVAAARIRAHRGYARLRALLGHLEGP